MVKNRFLPLLCAALWVLAKSAAYPQDAPTTTNSPSQNVAALEGAANAGDVKAMLTLANLYLSGKEVRRDILEARKWAKAAADLNDPTGECMFYVTVSEGPELNYFTAGKPDMKLYQALAKRPVEERSLDIAAYTYLTKSLAQNSDEARFFTIRELMDHAAPGNRDLMLSLMPQLQKPFPQFEKIAAMVAQEKELGDSNTKPGMFGDVNRMGSLVALARVKAAPGTPVKLSKTTVSRPLADAVFLPIPAPLDHSYLLQGNWQEIWTFDVNGAQIDVPFEFQADSLGGAHYTARAN